VSVKVDAIFEPDWIVIDARNVKRGSFKLDEKTTLMLGDNLFIRKIDDRVEVFQLEAESSE
jgi:dTDP-glucose pyrophosphorylase